MPTFDQPNPYESPQVEERPVRLHRKKYNDVHWATLAIGITLSAIVTFWIGFFAAGFSLMSIVVLIGADQDKFGTWAFAAAMVVGFITSFLVARWVERKLTSAPPASRTVA